jgi:hypothetical protein
MVSDEVCKTKKDLGKSYETTKKNSLNRMFISGQYDDRLQWRQTITTT